MKQIPLTRGKFALVDDSDFEYLNQFKWHFGGGYATRWGGENCHNLFMHRQIVNAPLDKQVDHINSNPLDNRRENLRICTPAENHRNRIGRNKFSFKGVYKTRRKNGFMSSISNHYKTQYIGFYKTEKLAALAYNKKAIELFGEFAKLNKF